MKREDVLSEIHRYVSPREPVTVPEISDQMDVSNSIVYDRLKELYSMKMVDTKKVGAHARVWWLTEMEANTELPPNRPLGPAPDTKELLLATSSRREPWTSSEVANATGRTANSVYQTLRRLDEQGVINSKSAGSRAKVWWADPKAIADDRETTSMEMPD